MTLFKINLHDITVVTSFFSSITCFLIDFNFDHRHFLRNSLLYEFHFTDERLRTDLTSYY